MKPYIVNNVFSQEELQELRNAFNNTPLSVDLTLGRNLVYFDNFLHYELILKIKEKVQKIVESVTDKDLLCLGFSGADYNNQYGEPNLPPHYDGDTNDLIFNYQLSSNTSWGIGVDLEVYELEDNSAVVFHPNKNAHWRPIKKFNDGEHVHMLFFRFYDKNETNDYSYLPNHPLDPVFKDINELRDIL
jgi:hypothetical protein